MDDLEIIRDDYVLIWNRKVKEDKFEKQVQEAKNNNRVFGFEFNLTDYCYNVISEKEDNYIFDHITYDKTKNTLSWYSIEIDVDLGFDLDQNLEALHEKITESFCNDPEKWIHEI